MILPGLVLLLLSSGSSIVQAIWFPRAEPSGWSLFVAWVVTAGCLFAASVLLLQGRETLPYTLFSLVSSLTVAVLIAAILIYSLGGNKGVNGLEYSAMATYALLFLGFVVLGAAIRRRS